MNEMDKLRKIIVDEVAKDAPDWHLIERLTREEVDANTRNIRFSVDAGHIQRLGLELVAKQETALAELIKNAYDADATRVVVTFTNHDRPYGDLVVEDNGSGMTIDIVRNAWMRLSTPNKQLNPTSTKYHRVRAGRKGIGRFAVQRLGKKLLLETEVEGSMVGLRVHFDWDSQFNAGTNLTDIFSNVEEYDKPVERAGTRLIIHALRESWSDTALRKVWKMILSLQSPFVSLADQLPTLKENGDPGFEVLLNGISSKKQQTSLGIESGFLQHAVADISGEVGADGTATVRVVSAKLGLNESHQLAKKVSLTGQLKFSAKYFIYKADVLSGLSVQLAQDMGREYGGIRIYRNGFRVAPYGERADDWLRLDRDTSRRVIIVPANNVNFFGQVALSSDDNPLFEETSSREGLIENEAFEELRSVVRASLEWAFLRVAAVRGRKQTAGQKDFVSTVRPRKPSEVIENLINTIDPPTSENTLPPSPDNSSNPTQGRFDDPDSSHPTFQSGPNSLIAAKQAFEVARQEMKLWEADVEQREAAALEYEEMLRILASLGLSISVFGHEIKGIRGSVSAHLAVLSGEVEALPTSDAAVNLTSTLKGLQSATGRMFDLGGYIAGLMSSTESRDLQTLSVKGAIQRFQQQFKQYMQRQKIDFEWEVNPESLRTVAMHASELDSVLLNFLTNSIKSMKASKVLPRRVRISAREQDNLAVLSFEDNGTGIPDEIQHRIFDAFFTTTVNLDDDGLAGPGTGLGLKIVSDIANSYGGSVSVGTPSEGYTCNIEFRVLTDASTGE